jgi:3-hydroxyacyl-CoA dehydrogenase
MHFFYPAHIMKLVEVIPGLDTSEETTGDIIAFAESLRKLPVRVNECPGFLVNRILMPYLNEAAYCVQEAAASAREIDEAAVQFGFPMGPFTLVDNLGFDVCREVVNVLLDAYGSRMAPAAIWERLYALKRYGTKSGAGFYLYGERAGQPDPDLDRVITELRAARKTPTAFSIHRLVLPMINEAIRCLEERVCTAADADLSVIAGLGFPQSKGGILHYADEVGLDAVLKELEQLTKAHGERFWPSPLLKRKVAAGHLGRKTKKGFFEYTE